MLLPLAIVVSITIMQEVNYLYSSQLPKESKHIAQMPDKTDAKKI